MFTKNWRGRSCFYEAVSAINTSWHIALKQLASQMFDLSGSWTTLTNTCSLSGPDQSLALRAPGPLSLSYFKQPSWAVTPEDFLVSPVISELAQITIMAALANSSMDSGIPEHWTTRRARNSFLKDRVLHSGKQEPDSLQANPLPHFSSSSGLLGTHFLLAASPEKVHESNSHVWWITSADETANSEAVWEYSLYVASCLPCLTFPFKYGIQTSIFVTGFPPVCVLSRFSCLRLFATSWTVAHQTPLSMGFSRQKSWNGLPCPPSGGLLNPAIEPGSLAL